MIYLLDTSAWLEHLFGGPGMAEVIRLMEDASAELAISAVSLPEFYGCLKRLGRERDFDQTWAQYRLIFDLIFPADQKVAMQSVVLRQNTGVRIPAVDALIAATAATHNAVLVHRDPHFETIPPHLLKQQMLPTK